MKEYVVAVLSAAFIISTLLMFHKPVNQVESEEILSLFTNWKKKYNRNYDSTEEESYRLKNYAKNLNKINTHNANKSNTYTMAPNNFMDLSHEEFKAFYLSGLKINKNQISSENFQKPSISRPDKWDWRDHGKTIRSVKNQGQCGSCWAFSATGALEGLATIKKNITDEYSEQQLVDCSKSYGNEGCNGGWMDSAFAYVRDKGITTEKDYPYQAYEQKCKKDFGAFKISGFQDLPPKNIETLADTVVQQPIAIAVDATNWSFYHQGIFRDCYEDLNHGVLLVGQQKKDCWYVKNSWDINWGWMGYIWLAWGNTCGLADAASIPVLS